ncbi:MAG: two-component regulator propeller domain-containing protein [Mariniphaga sp.]
MKSFSLIITLMLFAGLLCGNNYAKNTAYITKEDGLSQNYVSSIIQDNSGFMWFGTMDGLNCYDGYTFKVYYSKSDDTTSLSCNQIKRLIIGNDGSIWVGTYNGLNRFNPATNKFKRYPILSPTSRKNEIGYLAVDHSGVIWFGYTDDECLISLDPSNESVTFYKLPVLSTSQKLNPLEAKREVYSIGSLLVASNNNIWVGTTEGTLLLFDNTLKKFTENNLIDPSSNIYAIAEINTDSLCLGTFNNGFCFYNNKDKRRGPLYNFNRTGKKEISLLWSIEKGPDGNLWFGTWESGFFQLELKKRRLNQIYLSTPGNTGISGRSVCSIFFDKSGLLWCGTNGYGLYNLNPLQTGFNTINQEIKGVMEQTTSSDLDLYALSDSDSKNNSLSFQSLRSVYANNDYIWVGGYSGLNKIDRKTGLIKVIDKQLIPYVMRPDFDNPESILYIGAEMDGAPLYSLNLKTDQLAKLNFKGNTIYSICPGKDFLWLGGRDGLIKYNLKTGKDEPFPRGEMKIENQKTGIIKAMTKDLNGNLWVGIQGVGLAKLNELNNTFTIWNNKPNQPNSLSNDVIIFLNCDENNRLWIGTNGGGLNIFDINSETFTRINTKNGLPNDVVYAALSDNEKKIWISTNNGICKFDLEDMKIKCYSVSDGLQGNEFNTSAYFRDTKGTMFFGGINGLTYFTPENFRESHFKPDIVLTSVKKYNEEVLFDKPLTDLKQITFAYNDKIFSLTFSALSFYQSNRNKYKYRITGLKDQWINLNSKREIIFNGLPSGDYTLEVLASNHDDYWTDNPLSLKIHITSPFWETSWFYGLCIAFLFLMIWIYMRYHTASIIRFNERLRVEVDNKTKEILEQNHEIESQKEQVERINEALKRSNATKDKFFGIIAHDLKGPFNAILGFTRMLHEEYDNFSDEERREFISDIMNASGSAFKLLENLLEWARLQSGKIELTPDKIDLYNISQETLELFHSATAAKKIQLTSEIAPETFIYADRNMVRTIVRNLVSNAIKFTYPNGKIKITSDKNENGVELSIADDGIGMLPKVVDKLFDLDSKTYIKGTNDETGTGLGLILCKEFIEKNNG